MNLQLHLKVNYIKFENHTLYNMYKIHKRLDTGIIKCYGFNLSSDVFFCCFNFSGCADGGHATKPGGGVLRISSDAFEMLDSRVFLGRKIWRVFFWVACMIN